MRVLRCQDKEELLEKLSKINKEDEEIYISLRPTQEIVERLIEETESIKKLKCPKSLYYQVGEKVENKLQKKGVELEPGEFSPGRPRKYSDEEIDRMIQMREEGFPVNEISERMDVPVRTVYFYLNKRQG